MNWLIYNSWLGSFRDTIFRALTENGTPFQALGMNIFRTLAIVMLVFAGIRIAFNDPQAFPKLRGLTGLLLATWIMMTLYTQPSPFLGGESFSQVIPKTAFALADQVGTTTQQELITALQDYLSGTLDVFSPSFLDFTESLEFLAVMVLILVLELGMFIVVSFGYLALGAILVIGPILIPFVLAPKLDFLFWSWLKALIKYSFYPVIGNVVILGVSRLLLATLGNGSLLGNAAAGVTGLSTPGAAAGRIAVNVFQHPLIVIVFLLGIYSIFKIPALVSDIFSGAASAGSGAQQAVSSAISAAVSL